MSARRTRELKLKFSISEIKIFAAVLPVAVAAKFKDADGLPEKEEHAWTNFI